MDFELVNLAILVGTSLAIALFVFHVFDRPAGLIALKKFGSRRGLVITDRNGIQVAAYLRIARRWRMACVTLAVCLSVGYGLTQQRFTISFTAILAGLFAGVLFAEVRMAGLTSVKRAAALAPRRLSNYLHRTGRSALAGALLLFALLVIIRPELTIGTVASPVIGLIAWLSIRRILRRAQPVAEPDRIAADNAIRTQSLQTLAASGSALIAYAILAQLAQLGVPGLLLIPIGLIGIPWFAWRIANHRMEPPTHAIT